MAEKYCIRVENKEDSTRIQEKLFKTGRHWIFEPLHRLWYPHNEEKYYIFIYENDKNICYSDMCFYAGAVLLTEKELDDCLGLSSGQLELEF